MARLIQRTMQRYIFFRSFYELVKFFEIQKNNSTIPPNYRTFVRQIKYWIASSLAVTRSDDKDSPEYIESLNLKF